MGGKVALNRGSGLRRFNTTFPPDIKGKTLANILVFLFRGLMYLRSVLVICLMTGRFRDISSSVSGFEEHKE